MIEVQSLSKVFAAKTALSGANFVIERPQMVGVIGRSGAGKSTLLRIINRLTTATSGKVIVDGRDVLALKGSGLRAWQRDCAMIFQQFNLVPRLDVLTNVMLGRLNGRAMLPSLLKMFSRSDRIDGLMALERLGIADTALQRAESLSGGQQQRVAIARALMQSPKMILADEPIASLDPLNAKVVMDALRSIHDSQNINVLCNLHTLDTARAYCDRIIGMRAGAIVFDGAARDLTEAAARDIYGAGSEFNEAATSVNIGPSPVEVRTHSDAAAQAAGTTGSAAAVTAA